MFGPVFYGYTLCGIFPLMMIILCVFMCVLMTRLRLGSMMCRPGSRSKVRDKGDASDSALDALNKHSWRDP